MRAGLLDPRKVATARKALYQRRIGRAGVGKCPGCGGLVVLCRYVPKVLRPGTRPVLVFDFPAAARGNTYANHATTSSFLTARLITDDLPLEDHEIRVVPHIARHPECGPFLTGPRA